MKKLVLLLLSIIALQANAQFSYSVKAGWSWPDIHKHTVKEQKSSFTLGASIDYAINEYLGVQSGLNYKRICHVNLYEGGITEDADDQFTEKAHYIEVPLLLTASIIPNPQRWRAIWNAGMFVDVPVGGDKGKTYYGLMAALQIEVRSHYFLRGEYQWALSSDRKGEWSEDRRTNILSVSLGYRF